jgi:hypothetical protein
LAKDLCSIFDYSVQSAFKDCTKLKLLNVEEVKEQIKKMRDNFGIKYILFEEIIGSHQYDEFKIIEKLLEENDL